MIHETKLFRIGILSKIKDYLFIVVWTFVFYSERGVSWRIDIICMQEKLDIVRCKVKDKDVKLLKWILSKNSGDLLNMKQIKSIQEVERMNV